MMKYVPRTFCRKTYILYVFKELLFALLCAESDSASLDETNLLRKSSAFYGLNLDVICCLCSRDVVECVGKCAVKGAP
jgi:hypothetical protein